MLPRRLAHLTVLVAVAVSNAGSALAQQSQKPKAALMPHPGGIPVAIIGPGVDYTRPEIARRLARDGEGEPIQFDAVARDTRPFSPSDAQSSDTRHMLAAMEALPRAAFIVARTLPVKVGPTQAPEAAARATGMTVQPAFGFIAATPARIAIVAIDQSAFVGLATAQQLAVLAQSGLTTVLRSNIVKAMPNLGANNRLLTIIPAGDLSLDLSFEKGGPLFQVYAQTREAAAAAPVLVVTAADPQGTQLPTSNFSLADVDLAVGVPAEGPVAPSVRAALRVARIAHDLLAADPKLNPMDLKARIIARAKAPRGQPGVTRYGTLLE